MKTTPTLRAHPVLPSAATVVFSLFAALWPGAVRLRGRRRRIRAIIRRSTSSPHELDYYDKDQKLVYTGNVVAIRGDTTLKTPRLTVFLAPKPHGAQAQKVSSSDRIRRMEAWAR